MLVMARTFREVVMGVALRRSCVLAALVACGCAGGGSSTPNETTTTARVPVDPTAPAPDMAPQVVFFPRFGNPEDDMHGSLGPGVVLMNGGLTPASAVVWMHDTVDRARVAGDVVVLCTHGDDEYAAPLYAEAPFNSVQTVLVPDGATQEDVQLVAQRVESAEVVFLADGDPASYVRWAGGPIVNAIRDVFGHGGVIAGTGAGAAALGAVVLTTDVATAAALANPYDAAIDLLPGPFGASFLAGTIIDFRTKAADRFGRLAALTARMIADGLAGTIAAPMTVGIGLDDGTALAIDRAGRAAVFLDAGATGAWLLHGGTVDRIAAGQPLLWKTAGVTRFDAVGESYDFGRGCGTAFSYTVAIDGAASAPFTPADPYDAQGMSAPCP
jgi:cyanophycinase-like exopeptidase